MGSRFATTRRWTSALFAAVALASSPALANGSHGLSIFGELKYPADFKHFDYVNPDAPKGGRMATIGCISIDSYNPYILKVESASGMSQLFDSVV